VEELDEVVEQMEFIESFDQQRMYSLSQNSTVKVGGIYLAWSRSDFFNKMLIGGFKGDEKGLRIRWNCRSCLRSDFCSETLIGSFKDASVRNELS
jgi:hypothetical protein